MIKRIMMKKLINNIAFGFGIIVLVSSAQAQQMPQTNLYTDNVYNINPAYAGYNANCLEAYIGHMTQWVGVDGAPSTNYLDVHKGIGSNFGLGGGFILDNTAMINRFSGNLSGSYRLKLGDESNLRFGLSLGMYQVSINTSDAVVQDVTDEVIAGNASGITFNNEVGMIYNYKKFLIGVAVPQVFETDAKYDLQTTQASFGVQRHFTAFAKYGWDVSDKWQIEPSAMMKSVTGVNQFDVNVMGTYNDLISAGIGYRTDVGLLARVKLRLKDLFVLAYAYEFAGSNMSSYSSGSHEIMLGIRFCKEQKMDEPRIESATPPLPVEEPVEEPEPVAEPEPVEDREPEPTVKPEPAENPKPSPEETKVFDAEIPFGLGDVTVSPSSVAKLNRMVKIMKKYPDLKLEIVGHSCDKGTDLRKEVVSSTRAENAKRYMVSKGIDGGRISSLGASDSQPSVPNTSDENRSKNRRVEFNLSGI